MQLSTSQLSICINDTIPSTDVAISLAVDTDSIFGGSQVIYTLTISIVGNTCTSATNVIVEDTLPFGTTYLSHIIVQGDTGITYDPVSGILNIPLITIGDSTIIDIIVEIDSNINNRCNIIQNCAVLLSLNENDLVISNNSSCVDIFAVTPVHAGDDKSVCTVDSIIIGPQITDTSFIYSWLPITGLNNSNIANPFASPDSTTEYILIASDTITGCITYDTVIVHVGAIAGSDKNICLGDSIIIGPQIINNTYTYTWMPSTGLNDPNIPNPIAKPDSTTEYVLLLSDTIIGCAEYDTLLVIVTEIKPIADAGPDVSICLEESIVIGPGIINDTLTYTWSPSNGLDDTNIPNPTASPDTTTVYILMVSNPLTGCINYDTILLTVIFPIADAGSDTSICLGDSIILGPQCININFLYTWFPIEGLNNSTIQILQHHQTALLNIL